MPPDWILTEPNIYPDLSAVLPEILGMGDAHKKSLVIELKLSVIPYSKQKLTQLPL